MIFERTMTLSDGRECILRNGRYEDGEAVLESFNAAHAQTDYLLTYPEESTFTVEDERKYLQEKTDSDNEIEIIAIVDGAVPATAGFEAVGRSIKIRHRCDFGISVDRAYWGLGIGKALTEACIECAVKAGYEQMELQAVSENERALELYRKAGFTEFGRNPKGFREKEGGYQELVYMRLEL